MVYRRKIEPGDGYRLLVPGDAVIKGDQIFMPRDQEWRDALLVGSIVKSALFRRRVEPEIKPGEGYVLLKPGDELRFDDEYWTDNYWCCVGSFTGAWTNPACKAVRRKVKPAKPEIQPGEGYRLLEPGETIVKGDEFLNTRSGRWRQVSGSIGYVVKSRFSKERHAFRRAIPVEPKNPSPGTGYRLLAPGEIIQRGDQRLNSRGEWKLRMHAVGSALQPDDDPTRRPVKNYRLLSVGEYTREGDQYYNLSRWVPVTCTYVVDEKSTVPVRREIVEHTGGPA